MVCFFPTNVANWTSVYLEAFAGQMPGCTHETQWPALQLCQASSPRDRASARVTTGDLQQAVSQLKKFDSELNTYVQLAVSIVLETIRQSPDKKP